MLQPNKPKISKALYAVLPSTQRTLPLEPRMKRHFFRSIQSQKLLISKTRLGIRIRAGEADREMIAALGVDIAKLYTLVFALGAALAGLAGALVGAIQSVQVGMGEPVLILAFVVIVIGGIGSIKGALIGALLVGLTDTLGSVLLPLFFANFMEASAATSVGSSLASMSIYILMAGVLLFKPTGLFGEA